jgi:hypothetical protein
MRSPLDVKLSHPHCEPGIDLVFQRIGDAIPQPSSTTPASINNQPFFKAPPYK